MEELEKEQPKKSKGKSIVIGLLSLLLVGSGVSNFMLWQKEKESTAIAVSSIDSLKLNQKIKDSLNNELIDEIAKTESLRAEIMIYEGENDSLKQILAEKEARIASIRAQLNGGGLSNSKLRALKDSLVVIRTENNDFKTKLESLLLENENYKAQLAEKEAKISTLNSTNTALSEKVSIAEKPFVSPINAVPQYEKKGVFLPIYKAKKVEKLLITFTVLGNKLTKNSVEKTYVVRVKNPDGIILSNNNNQLSNIDDVYTYKETVTFDGKQKPIKINYTQKPDYKKGKYTVELKDGDEVLSTFNFELL